MKSTQSIMLMAALFVTPFAHAKPVTPNTPVADPLVFTLLSPVPVANDPFQLSGANGDTLSITYSGVSNASRIWFSKNANGNTSQDSAELETLIEDSSLFNGNIDFAQDNDNAGGGNSASFTNTSLFSILAVHFGKHELIFDFGKQIALGTTFNITTAGQAAGLSNFRAYLDPNATGVPPAAVPVPTAAWLFGSGLVGLISVNRRKSQLAI